ncbi:MAG: NAD-binding protein, partial [Planctomycetota bacterium]
MSIVIVSSGHVAREFATSLSREYDVAVVHDGEEGRAELDKLDVEILAGTGNDLEILRSAGTEHASYLVACAASDEMNILACLAARRLGKAQTICFVSKKEYVRTFGADDETGWGGTPELGVDHLVWPAAMLADKILEILTVPGAIDVARFARGKLSLLEYRLPENSFLVNRPLMEIRGLPPGVLIVAVTRGEEWFVPRGQSVLVPGDRVHFMGRTEAMRQLAAGFGDLLGAAGKGDLVIVGGGTVGERIAQKLEASPRTRIKLIESDPVRCRELAE